MVDIVAGCKRGYNWFKGILKAVWEFLKKLFPPSRKSNKNNKNNKNSGNKQKNKNQCDGDKCDNSGQQGQDQQDGDGGGNQECENCQNGGDNSSESGGSGSDSDTDAAEESDGQANEADNADVSDSSERRDQIRSAQDDFHRRVEEAEQRGEFDTVDTEEHGAIEDPDSDEEAVEESESGEPLGKSDESGSGGSDEFQEPVITGKKVSAVEAALAEAFTNEETSDCETVIADGITAGSEVELIDNSELQNARRLTVIPSQKRETRAVYD